MSIYAIGDIHGSLDLLDALLDKLDRKGPIEQLWFVGDLVNRGPDTAGVLRRIRSLGERAITILGNHDLSLLGKICCGIGIDEVAPGTRSLMEADDRDELLAWLRNRPLMHQNRTIDWTMVHAGIPPAWDIPKALQHARELETAIRGPNHAQVLSQIIGPVTNTWNEGLAGIERLRFIANALTRIRFVGEDGHLDMKYKQTIAKAPRQLTPWFIEPERASANARIVFGHWAALERMAWPTHSVWCIDSGAAWGGALSALNLTTQPPEVIQVRRGEQGGLDPT